MQNEKYLPLGSIVIINGTVRKLIIVGRALMQKVNDERRYFDYACCTYPEGLISDQAIYINHEDIDEVIFTGFSDDDDVRMQKNIKEQVEKLKLSASK